MAAEAVGFMARGASGGRAAELVTRDFLGGCAAADDARDAAARHDAVVSPHPHGSVFQQLSRCSNLPCSFSLPAGCRAPSVCLDDYERSEQENFERRRKLIGSAALGFLRASYRLPAQIMIIIFASFGSYFPIRRG